MIKKLLLTSALLLLVPLLVRSGYVDLTHPFDNDETMVSPTSQPYEFKVVSKGYTDKGYWYESNDICSSVNAGTHMDAPSQYAEGKWTVDQIPITRLMNIHGVVVDIRGKVEEDPNAELTTDDLMEWLDEHGPLPDPVVVFVLTGWSSRYGNKTAYYGTMINDTSNLEFPGINPGAAQLLTGYEAATGSRVVGVGIDTPSLDHGPSEQFETHVELAKNNIYGLESVANLEALPTTGFHVTVLPMYIEGGSGAATRIIAMVPEGSSANKAVSQILVLLPFTLLALAYVAL